MLAKLRLTLFGSDGSTSPDVRGVKCSSGVSIQVRQTQLCLSFRPVCCSRALRWHVGFTYNNDGNSTFRTDGTSKLQETILSIMGHDTASKMLPVLL